MGRGLSDLQKQILALTESNRRAAANIPDNPATEVMGITIPANSDRRDAAVTTMADVLQHCYGWTPRQGYGGRTGRFSTNEGKPGDRVSARRSVLRLFDRGLLERQGWNNSRFHITEAGTAAVGQFGTTVLIYSR